MHMSQGSSQQRGGHQESPERYGANIGPSAFRYASNDEGSHGGELFNFNVPPKQGRNKFDADQLEIESYGGRGAPSTGTYGQNDDVVGVRSEVSQGKALSHQPNFYAQRSGAFG